MIGCLLIAFALCAPPGYYGPSYGYGQGYVVQQPVYYQPQPVYVAQPMPIYYAQPAPYYGGGPSINLNFGGGGRGYYNQGPRYYRR